MLKSIKGAFIAFEGIEGVGKSTNIKFLSNTLEQAGYQVVVTREPGGTAIAESIRNLFLAEHHETMLPVTELLLLFAARAQHIEKVIKPALASGKCVLTDRFTDATYAYQGGGKDIDASHIAYLEQLVQGNLRPDLTFLLDVPVEVGINRALARADTNRFEQEKIAFFERVRAIYLKRAKMMPDRYKIINAALPIQEVQQKILNLLNLPNFSDELIS